jgi:glutaconate CoA-transferase subunit A
LDTHDEGDRMSNATELRTPRSHCEMSGLRPLFRDGMRIGLGGFWFVRNPHALVDELIESGASDLEIVSFGGGIGIERLLAAGRVRKLYISFNSMDVFGLSPNFRRVAEDGSVEVVEVTTMVMHKALQAARENVPSLPVLGPLESDFLTTNYPLTPYECPVSGKSMYAVPALPLDLTLLHAQRADEDGQVEIAGARGLDTKLAEAADKVAVSVEEVVPAFTGDRASRTTVPRFLVDKLVVAPGGAYPGSCLPYYVTDYLYLDQLLEEGTGIAPAKLLGSDRLEARPDRARRIAARAMEIEIRGPERDAEPAVPATEDELMVTTLARLLVDDGVYQVGSVTPLSLVAYQLARLTHAPNLSLIAFAGHVDVASYPSGILLAEPFAWRTGHALWGMDDGQDLLYQRSAIDAEIFTPAQMDGDGNLNNSRIGTGAMPDVRLPGQAGIADVTVLHRNLYIYAARHDRRRFVERVDFRGGHRALFGEAERADRGLGPGRTLIITPLCVFEQSLESHQLEVVSLHPGHTLEEVREATGFEFGVAEGCGETALPSARELELIRTRIDPFGLRRLEFVPNRDRRPLIREIIAAELELLGLDEEVSDDAA